VPSGCSLPRPRIFGTQKCFYKARRITPRVFSENDAVRICCDVIQNARGTYKEINLRIAACSQSQHHEEFQDEAAAERAAQAVLDISLQIQAMYVASDRLLAQCGAAFIIIVGILQGLQLLSRVFPITRITSVPLGLILQQSQALVVRIAAQRAANDSYFRASTQILRQVTIHRRAGGV